LRHFESSAQETAADPAASQLADAVYDQMRFLADDPYDCLALSRLDDLRGQFEASVAFLEPILLKQDHERIRLRRELATTQARLNSCLDQERRMAELEEQCAAAWSMSRLRRPRRAPFGSPSVLHNDSCGVARSSRAW
jgi:hypothetical protein